MTHGEEPGPETHKDSAVLTYLEGLLMHPVVAGPGAAASRRSEAAHSNQEQADKAGGPFLPPGRGTAAPRPSGPSSLGASQHLKKARLLRSGAWSEAGSQRTATPPATTAAAAQLNGHQGAGGQNGALGEGTLLASLLQSFSSRLQSVALSQHAAGEPPGEQRSPPPTASAAEPAPAAYGTASSRLKGLMRKSKAACHSGTPYTRRVAAGQGQDRPPESSPPPATPPAAASEAVSCAERLKAVANMVKIRSSPAPSPKPSLACSQLALLLSSEAHLQQYSREHALKARLSGRSASERLAAMATQQQVGGTDKRPPSAGEPPPAAPPPPLPDALGGFPAQNGTAARAPAPAAALPGQRSPSLQRGPNQTSPPPPSPQHATRHTHTLSHAPSHALSHTRTLTNNPGQLPREKRAFDSRPSRPPQTCSSLLLLLLNNHNSQRQLTKNGHLEEEDEEEEEEEEGRGEDGGGGSGLPLPPPSCSSSVTSDSECSAQERSLAKDSDDAESSYSSCSPIDLSVRSRGAAPGPKTSSSSSSSSTTSSSLSSSAMFSSARTAFSPPPCVHPSLAASSSCSSSFTGPSLDKMTESLINKWKPEACGGSKVVPRAREEPEPHPKLTLMQLLLERRNTDRAARSGDLPLDVTMATMSVPPGPRGGGGAGETRTPSPYSHPSPGVQSSPLDLCKSKAAAAEPAFSASKLLQNLAQCGVASASPSPPTCRAPETVLLERLGGPVLHRSTATTPLSDGPPASGTPLCRGTGGSPPAVLSPSSSQIENLLERRTVLQLLLGTGSTTTTTTAAVATAATCTRQDRAGGGRGGAELQAGSSERHPALCNSSNGPLADVKVKTERQEEASEDFNGRKRRGWGGGGKTSPVPSELPADFKTEQPLPRPTEVVAKYGLLSQLLKQQTATYYASAAAQPQPRQVKEELPGDCRGPSPKKRLLCPERAAGDGLGLVSTLQEEARHRRTPKEAGVGAAAPARSPPTDSPARESRGFNVLKQLLLSDNCLKELSQQPRAACSSSALQANGHPVIAAPVPSQPSHNHSFLHPSWQPHPSLSLGLHGNLRPLPNNNNTTTTNNNNSSSSLPGDAPLRFPWDHHPAPWAVSQKRDAPTLVKQEPESPVRWSGQEDEDEDEGGDSNRDSPRLTRSNPILYYMLQKGSAQLRRELRDQAEGTRPAACVKEEPIGDAHTYEHRLSSAPHSPPPHSDKHSRKSHGLSQSSE